MVITATWKPPPGPELEQEYEKQQQIWLFPKRCTLWLILLSVNIYLTPYARHKSSGGHQLTRWREVESRGVKVRWLGAPLFPSFNGSDPCLPEESACTRNSRPSFFFLIAATKIFSPLELKKQQTPQRKHFSRLCGRPRKPQLVEKLVSCRWEVRNFEQSIMFTV